MRFSEKSFEVRFCAALSAALMPFNRNPQWFGLTQAQERRAGIDTMLKSGGELLVFQFKAAFKNSGQPKFRVEREQWEALTGFTRRHPKSVFYVFPQATTVREASESSCLIKQSWCTEANNLKGFFKGKEKTRTLTLSAKEKSLCSSRRSHTASLESVCAKFGCFCPPGPRSVCCIEYDKDGVHFFVSYLSEKGAGSFLGTSNRPIFPLPERILGIPIGKISPPRDIRQPGFPDERPRHDEPESPAESPAIKSWEDFEQLLGDKAGKRLHSGLYGLFLPYDKR